MLVALLALLLGMVGVGQAQAATQQNAYYYSHWNFGGSSTGYWNVDQQMQVTRKPGSTYWALYWDWVGSSDGGYLGLQTNGNRFNGTSGDTAIFSLWNANAATGTACGQFEENGPGYSCRLPYSFGINTYYRYRLWRLNANSGGQWWGAWIQNVSTGTGTQIGAIRVATDRTAATDVQNFVEYFGTAVPTCDQVPVSQAVWTQPAANSQGGGAYQYGSTYRATSTDRGACTGGIATPVNLGWTSGVRVTLGGHR